MSSDVLDVDVTGVSGGEIKLAAVVKLRFGRTKTAKSSISAARTLT
ncbi:MAG: hypothetical protein ACLUSP_09800 [Christensenellales bacterium]